MELACALVLLVVGSVLAGPYGYGTKGGVAAKADARAVAGAYTGAASLPLSIPSGSSYSGSFSQSSSSSSSSSSASSNSFSYNGSGAIGGGVPGSGGCSSGNCNSGGATGSQGLATAGSQAYSGALAGGYGSKITSGSYGHKYGNSEEANKGQDCGSGGCQEKNDSNISNGNGAGIGSLSSSNAKAAASAGAGHTVGSDCGGSNCNDVPSADDKCVSGQCGSNTKCSSGDCESASNIRDTPSSYDDSNKCTSGHCEPSQGSDESSSIDSNTDDIKVHATGSANSKSYYGAEKPGCYNGNCGSSSTSGSSLVSGYNKPALDLTAPKLEPSCSGNNCQISPSGSNTNSKAPYISTSYQNGNQLGPVSSPDYGSNSNPTYAHASLPSSPVKPLGGANCVPGTPGCAVISALGGTSASGYDGSSSGAPSYSHGSTPLVNPSSADCAPGTPGCIQLPSHSVSPDCASGNCGSFCLFCLSAPSGHVSSSGNKPSPGSPSSYSSVNPTGSGCTPGYPGCATSSISPSGPSGCASGKCGGSLTSTGDSNKASYSHGGSPSYFPSKQPGAGCAPGTPGCGLAPLATGSSSCASGDCSVNPLAPGYESSSNIRPSNSYESSLSHIPVKPVGLPCAPGNPGCSIALSANRPSDCISGNCGAYPSLHVGSTSHNAAYGVHGIESLQTSLNKPSTGLPTGISGSGAFTPGISSVPSASSSAPGIGSSTQLGIAGATSGFSGEHGAKENLPVYTGGFGGPAGVLKPNEYSAAPASSYGNKATVSTGSTTVKPSCVSGTCDAQSPSAPNSQGVPSFSTLIPSVPACTPGSPGCAQSPAATGPSTVGCTSGNCGTYPTSAGGSLGTKPSYSVGSFSTHAQIIPTEPACTPGTPGCVLPLTPKGPSGCTSGNCDEFLPTGGEGGFPSIKPSYSQGSSSYFPVKPSGPGCTPGTPGCAMTPTNPSGCASGNCGANPSPQGCSPGNPGCSDFPSSIHSGDLGFPTGFPSIGTSNVPSSGISSLPSGHTSTGISAPGYSASGVGSTSHNAAYGVHGIGSLQTSFKKPSTELPTGISGIGAYTPGISSVPSASSSAPGIESSTQLGIAGATSGSSGEHGAKENLPVYTGSFGGPAGVLKPNEYPTTSYGNKPTVTTSSTTVKPSCVSGTCDTQSPSAPGYGGSSSTKPYNTQGVPSFSTLSPSVPACASGSPGCAQSPAATGPSAIGCTSGNCGTYPTSAGSGSLGTKPSYSVGSFSTHAQIKPTGPACAPGTPGCVLPLAPKYPSGCISGNCNEFLPTGGQSGFPSFKPSYSQGSSSYFPVKPSGPGCTPGAPGCAMTPTNPSGCASGNCGANPSPQGCSPGNPRCSDFPSNINSGALGFPSGYPSIGTSNVPSSGISSLPSGHTTGISAPGYSASGVGSTSHNAAYGVYGIGSLQTSLNKPSIGLPTGISGSGAYTPGISSVPSASSSAPGIGSSTQLDIAGATSGSSGEHGAKENIPVYTGSFGGPAGVLKPNEYSAAPTTSYGNKPTVSTGSTSVKPSCVSGTCDASSSLAHGGTTIGALATAEASASANEVAYTAGFGGPPGLLKPYDNGKSDIKGATGLAASLHTHQEVGGSGYLGGGSQVGGAGAQANAAAVSSAGASSEDNKFHYGGYNHGHEHYKTDIKGATGLAASLHKHQEVGGSGYLGGASQVGGAVAQTNAAAVSSAGASSGDNKFHYGGYNHGHEHYKTDIKGAIGLAASLQKHQEVGGSGYLGGGSQVGGAVAQANAAAVSSAGASSGNNKFHYGGYNHGHEHGSAGGCRGGCGGSGSLGYSGTLGFSKTGVLDDSSNGLAAAGAVAKSIASASSGARAFGGSYASSSATAHAGASVKGGYGRR